ncbi:hypothetical protein EVAR_17631_1 [Eumeta japonica]|uniref:Uncharacterized protein n=1 Tax=Eumeta variegata TaxID=151549 RepID=A0A4C1USU4_EUMVA|nr:hypothetical protein EVAR_17631_1 [Eumeta japonica]
MPKPTKLHNKGKTSSIQKSMGVSKEIPSTSDPEDNARQYQLELCWCIQQLERLLTDKKENERKYFQTVGQNEPEIIFKQKVDKAVQAFVTHSFRSKAVQTRIKTVDQALSPLKPSTISSSTSPFKATTIKKSSPSISNLIKITRNILIEEEHSDSDISLYTPSVATCSRFHHQCIHYK